MRERLTDTEAEWGLTRAEFAMRAVIRQREKMRRIRVASYQALKERPAPRRLGATERMPVAVRPLRSEEGRAAHIAAVGRAPGLPFVSYIHEPLT
mgnify:FL=1